MPLVTVFNLRRGDDLPAIETVITRTLSSVPELAINDWEIDVVPLMRVEGSAIESTRINVELWEHDERTKERLQAVAMRVAQGFHEVAGAERPVKVVIRPYDVETAGWVSV